MAQSPVLGGGECERVNEGRERENGLMLPAYCSNTVKTSF